MKHIIISFFFSHELEKSFFSRSDFEVIVFPKELKDFYEQSENPIIVDGSRNRILGFNDFESKEELSEEFDADSFFTNLQNQVSEAITLENVDTVFLFVDPDDYDRFMASLRSAPLDGFEQTSERLLPITSKDLHMVFIEEDDIPVMMPYEEFVKMFYVGPHQLGKEEILKLKILNTN